MSATPPPLPPAPPPSNAVPLLLSTLVYPGAGQFSQRRFGWALAYSTAFTLFFVVLMVVLVRMVRAAIFDGHVPEASDFRTLLKPLAMTFGVYVANVYDVWLVGHRKRRGAVPVT